MSVAKPAIRNLLIEKTKRDFVVASVLALGVAVAYKFGVQERRRKLFNDFYKTYDSKKDYNRMKQAGVFQSINQAVEEGKMSLD